MSYATIPVTPKHQFSGERLPSPPVAKLDSLSKEHRLNLYFKAFQKQDPHHSGRISVWGLKNALSELGIKPTAVTLFNIVDVRKEAESLFSFCDFTEFVTIIGDIDASEEEHKSSVRRAYNMLVESAELAVQQKSAGIRKASAESAVGEAAQKTPTAKVVTGDETMPFKIPHPSTYRFCPPKTERQDYSGEASHSFLDVDSLRETIEALGLPFDPDNQMIEFGNPDSLSFESVPVSSLH
ncbi:MAG: hypothetical protein MHM6MM_004330 [Cercozoa sp. M6MM]